MTVLTSRNGGFVAKRRPTVFTKISQSPPTITFLVFRGFWFAFLFNVSFPTVFLIGAHHFENIGF